MQILRDFQHYICNPFAGIAQLVEHDLAKVGVAGPSPVSRSKKRASIYGCPLFYGTQFFLPAPDIYQKIILNPEYLFYAYFRERMKDADFQAIAISLSDAIKKDLEAIGSLSIPFGGDESPEDLMKCRYMAGMPTFEKQVELAEFESFTQGS